MNSLDDDIAYLEYLEWPYVAELHGKYENTDPHYKLLWWEIVTYFKAKWALFKRRPFFIILTVVTIMALPVP